MDIARQEQLGETAFGSFSIDLQRARATWTAGCGRLLGMTDAERDAGEGATEALTLRLGEADREKVLAARDTAIRGSGYWRVSYTTRAASRVIERGQVEFDAAGQAVRADAIVTVPDLTVTARREVGLTRLTRMVGRVAHDFNNKLGVVLGSVDLARMSVQDEALARRLDAALEATVDAANESRLLLELARPTPRSVRRTRLADLVRSLTVPLEPHFRGRVNVVYRLDDEAPAVDVDSEDFTQALIELVDNAVEAMPHGGRIAVDVSATTLADGAPATMLSVSDTGDGMDEATLAEATRPWFTTRTVLEAPGLGLTMVREFARRAGGEFQLRSDADLGTVAELRLPMSRVPEDGLESPTHAAPPEPERYPANGERILVVDDELRLARATARQLEAEGYVTEIAGSARVALALLEVEPVDLLFTDVVMPGGMNGLQLAETVSAKYPDVAIMLTSGFTAGAGDPAAERHRFLEKPYPRETLMRAVGEVLAARRPAAN